MQLPFAREIEQEFKRKNEANAKLDAINYPHRREEEIYFRTIFEAEKIILFRFNYLYSQVAKEMMDDKLNVFVIDIVKEVCRRYPAFNAIGVKNLHEYINPPG